LSEFAYRNHLKPRLTLFTEQYCHNKYFLFIPLILLCLGEERKNACSVNGKTEMRRSGMILWGYRTERAL